MYEYYLGYRLICRLMSPYENHDDLAGLRRLIEGLHGTAWAALIDIANDNLVSPGLYSGLQTKGLSDLIDNEPRTYLKDLFELNQNRNEHLTVELKEAVRVLNSVGITPLLLKGAGQLVRPIHDAVGSRLLSDLDILIPPEQLFRTLDALFANGYEAMDVTYDFEKLHHWAPLFKPGQFGIIELHRRPFNKNVNHVLPTQNIVATAGNLTIDGCQFLLPDPTHAALICLLHSREFGPKEDPRQYNLRALHDLTAMNLSAYGRIDWTYIGSVLKKSGLSHLLEAYLVAAHKLFEMPYPKGARPGLTGRMQYTINMGVIRWPIVELLSRHTHDFMAFHISQRYGCALKPLPLAAYRMRYLAFLIRHKVRQLCRVP